MLYDYKNYLAFMAICLTVLASIPDLCGMSSRKTNPHPFTCLTWSLVTLRANVIHFVKGAGAGAGAWPPLAAALLCFTLTFLPISRGSKDSAKRDSEKLDNAKRDWYFSASSLWAIPLWVASKDPTCSASLVTATEIIAAFSTLRKSWLCPQQEVAFTYGINRIRSLMSRSALAPFAHAKAAYP